MTARLTFGTQHLVDYINRVLRDTYNDVQFIEQVLLTKFEYMKPEDVVHIKWFVAHLNEHHDSFERDLRNILKILNKEAEDNADTEI